MQLRNSRVKAEATAQRRSDDLLTKARCRRSVSEEVCRLSSTPQLNLVCRHSQALLIILANKASMSILVPAPSTGAASTCAGVRGLSALAVCSRGAHDAILSAAPKWASVGEAARAARKQIEAETTCGAQRRDDPSWTGNGVCISSPAPTGKKWKGFKVLSCENQYCACGAPTSKKSTSLDELAFATTDALCTATLRCTGAFYHGRRIGRWTMDFSKAKRMYVCEYARRTAAKNPSVNAAVLGAARTAFGL